MSADTSGQPFEISRVFDAPRALVWKAWTEADRLQRWWGPKGCPVSVKHCDVRPGGMFLYSMALPNGDVWWGRFVYEAVEAPGRLVYRSSFSDESGAAVRAPCNASWPLELLNELTLTEENGRTTVSLRGGPADATAEERALFESFFASMEQGFGGTFDQLAAYLRNER